LDVTNALSYPTNAPCAK